MSKSRHWKKEFKEEGIDRVMRCRPAEEEQVKE
jgi:hypothetical protein